MIYRLTIEGRIYLTEEEIETFEATRKLLQGEPPLIDIILGSFRLLLRSLIAVGI